MTENKTEPKAEKMDGTGTSSGEGPRHHGKPKYTVGELLLLAAHTLWQQLSAKIRKCMRDLKITERIDFCSRFLVLHPFIGLAIAGLVVIMGLPFVLFSILAFAIALLTFMGIVLVEGTVITIASIIFFGFFSCILLVLLSFGAAIVTGYFGFTQIIDLFEIRKMRKQRIANPNANANGNDQRAD